MAHHREWRQVQLLSYLDKVTKDIPRYYPSWTANRILVVQKYDGGEEMLVINWEGDMSG